MKSEIDAIIEEIWRPGWTSEAEMRGLLGLLADVIDKNIPGDVVEMGTGRGSTAVCLASLMERLWAMKELHVVDSFAGLPEKAAQDGLDERYKAGDIIADAEQLKALFFDRDLCLPRIHAGWFKEIDDYPEQICFGFLDGDFYSSIRDSLEALWPRLAIGGVLVIHDYGNKALPGVQRAVEAWGLAPIEHTGDGFIVTGIAYVKKR